MLRFKSSRGDVAQCRMKASAVVVLVDELLDMGPQIVDVVVLIAVNLLLFERLHEALAEGVIVGIARTAHAGQNAGGVDRKSVV